MESTNLKLADFNELALKVATEAAGTEHLLTVPGKIQPHPAVSREGKSVLGLAIKMDGGDERELIPHATAKRQLAEMTAIPLTYFEQLEKGNPNLLARCVSDGLDRNCESDRNLMRVNGEDLRAILPAKMRLFENSSMCDVVKMLMQEFGLDSDKCFLHADGTMVIDLLSGMEQDVSGGAENRQLQDIVRFGIRVKNNENTGGDTSMSLLTHRLVCLNGMVVPANGDNLRVPRGGGNYDHDLNSAIVIDAVDVNHIDAGAMLDVAMEGVGRILTKSKVQEHAGRIRNAQKIVVEVDSTSGMVRAIGKRLGLLLPESFYRAIGGHLATVLESGKTNIWQLLNLFTREAQNMSDLGMRAHIEQKVHNLMDLHERDIRELLSASARIADQSNGDTPSTATVV